MNAAPLALLVVSLLLSANAAWATPVISLIQDQTITEDGATGAIAFTITGIQSRAATVTGSSGNSQLVSSSGIVIGGTGGSRTVTVTPLPDQTGKATITITADDGLFGTGTRSFGLTVTAVNDRPTIKDLGDQTINEDQTLGPLSFTVGDIDTPVTGLSVTTSTSNSSLIPAASISVGGSGTARTLTITPALNQSGSSTIGVFVSDGTLSATTRFTLTVAAVNDPPSISDIADQTISEEGTAGPIAFAVSDPETAANSLTVTGRSSNPSLVPDGNIAVALAGATAPGRTVTVTPLPNQFGTATITLVVSDGSLSSSDQFTLTVNPINDRPTMSDISDQTINEDATAGPIGFTVDDIDTPVASLTLQGSSSNAALIPDSNVSFGGNGANRTVTVTPVAGQSGSATITVTVSDGSATASDKFVVTVTAVNHSPTISDIGDQAISEDANTGAVPFTVGDPDTGAANLTLQGSSSNQALIPDGAIRFGGSGANRTVTLTPLANQSGSALIVVTVSDGNLTAVDRFTVIVNAVNDPPTISDIADQTVSENSNTGALAFTIGDQDSDIASLTVQTSSSNTALVPAGNVAVGGTGASRTITVTPLSNQSGSATITVTVSDGFLSAVDQFTVTVTPVNDPPSISNISDQSVQGGSSTGSIAFTVDDPDTVASALTLSATSSNTALVPASAVLFGGSGNSRTVTVTPIGTQAGSATITATVSDGALTASDSFVVTVSATVDAPKILAPPQSATIKEGETATFTVSATGTAPLFYQWQFNGQDIAGATAPDYFVRNAQVTQSGKYTVRVSNAVGSVTSASATLVVSTPPAAEYDFGDAPDTVPGAVGGLGYPTLLANNGARHVIVQGFFLGKSVDAEANGQPNVDATGDDLNPKEMDDEDGVQFLSPLVPGQSAQVAVTASQPGRLDAWIDFNRNKSWADPGDQIFLSTTLVAGLNTLTFAVPGSAQGGLTFARFRLSKEGKLGFTGQASSGEVEDYQVSIEAAAPCDVNYKGTDFWLTFPGNYPPSPTAPLKLTLCLVGPQGITGTVAVAGLRFAKGFSMPASMSVEVTLPDASSLADVVDVVQTKGIHVTATAPVAVFGLNRIPYSSDGYLGLPVGVLGKEYIVSGYPNVFSEVSALNGTQFAMVASQDETSVMIVPAHTVLGHAKGEAYTVLLNKGQTYQLRDPNDATADLTGTEVLADKPIAVFGGHQCANINSPGKLFCDHLVEQLLPTTAWGKIFYTVPLVTRAGGDTFRILAAQDNTKIFLNGVANSTINRGQVHTLSLTSAARINADKPVHVAQFANSSDFDGVKNSDPFMVTVPPTRFYTRDHMICTGPDDFPKHYVNVVAPAGVVGSLTLDGVAVAAGLFSPIGASGFSSARLSVLPGPHTLNATQPFATIIYGFSLYESYGWPGGMFFGDITPPTIVCPPDFTVNLGGINPSTGAGGCKAAVPDIRSLAKVTDNCQLPSERVVTQTPAPGTPVEVGVYEITLTARDAADNEASCTVTMTVVDNGAVVMTCPQELNVHCTKGTGANVAFQVLAQSACGTPADVECNPASGAFFPLGTTPVKCVVKASPNQSCTFKVNVQCPAPGGGSNTIAAPHPLSFSWTGAYVLETSFSIDGPWTAVPEAVPPFTPAQGDTQQFFRLVQSVNTTLSKASPSPSRPVLTLE